MNAAAANAGGSAASPRRRGSVSAAAAIPGGAASPRGRDSVDAAAAIGGGAASPRGRDSVNAAAAIGGGAASPRGRDTVNAADSRRQARRPGRGGGLAVIHRFLGALRRSSTPARRGERRGAAAAVLAACALLLAACGAPAPAPALWRIADADSEIWIFGTIHVLPADLEWRSERVDAAFRAADTVIFEADISDSPEGAQLRQILLERGLDRSGETLSMKIGAADWALLERVAAKLNASPAAFEPFMPWFAAMQLSALYVQSLGQSFDVGVERVLDEEARAQGKTIAYLETPAEHVGVLADLPLQTQIAFLRATLEQLDAAQDELDAIDRAWVRGDTATLARLLNEDIEEAGPEAAHALLGARNARWRDRILTLLEGEGRLFIAVGAAHLVGDESVIALLRARGVRVEGP